MYAERKPRINTYGDSFTESQQVNDGESGKSIWPAIWGTGGELWGWRLWRLSGLSQDVAGRKVRSRRHNSDPPICRDDSIRSLY